MFTMAKIRNGETYLKTHLSANDYYCKEESVVGFWFGRGAEFLGIGGKEISSEDEAFERLRNNEHPLSGDKLTQRNKTTRRPNIEEARKSLCQKLRLKGKLKEGYVPSSAEIEAHRLKMKPICNRIAFFDFQCGCAKSVSIMALVGGDERLKQAHHLAVEVALQELESLAARQVDVKGRKHLKFTRNAAAAVFQHDSSRALDPQLHTHCVVANATYDEEKKQWFALTEFEMVKAIRYAGKVYQNELAKQVKALGYGIVERRSEKGFVEGFEIEGISPELMKRFSKRRAVIEKEIVAFKEKVGRLPSPAEIAVLTRESRTSKKLTEIATPDVRAHQMAQLSKEEVEMLSLVKKKAASFSKEVSETISSKILEDDQKETFSLQSAMNYLFERASVVSSHKLLAEALNQNLGSLNLEALKGHLSGKAETKVENLVDLSADQHPLANLFTSQEHLDHEAAAINYVNASMGKRPALMWEEPVVSDWLAKEQKEAIKFVCSNKDAVCAIRGVAGAGKTTMLLELNNHLLKAGHRLLYLAPTASAVDVLRKEGFEHAMTVSEYLIKAENEKFSNYVVVVDESGLQSTRQGYQVLQLAKKNWQRLVLVGDSKQHVSVEAGDFLRLLETHSKMKSNELKEIRRQVPREYRSAIALMAEGNAAEAMESFDEIGWINEGGAEYLVSAAKDYLAKSEFGKKIDSVIAVAPTWEENFSFTDGIRSGLKEHGVLGNGVMVDVFHSLQWTGEQKRQATGYKEGQLVIPNQKIGSLEKGASYVVERVEKNAVRLQGGISLPLNKGHLFDVGEKRLLELSHGDKILLRANDKVHQLINGAIVTVEKIQKNGTIVTQEGVVIPSSYRQFTHGYVITSHKSQGKTAEHVVVAAATMDEKAAYVATSRGKISCSIHTPDKEYLFDGVSRSSLRKVAFDVLEKTSSPLLTKITKIQMRSTHPVKQHIDKIAALGKKLIEMFPKFENVGKTKNMVLSETVNTMKPNIQLNNHHHPHSRVAFGM